MSEPQKTTIQATGSLTREGAIKALEMMLDHEPDDLSSPIGPWFTGMRDYITKYRTWPQIVDGSIVEPITDEKRLVE